jgi:glucosamine--fructose-6-phosphate aminotransferase (isomerizing)
MNEFLSELQQLPAALSALLDFYRADGKDLLAAWKSSADGKTGITFTGMGSSCISPLIIISRLRQAGIDARVMDAGEWLHYGGPGSTSSRELLVAVSQSGESAELRELLRAGKLKSGYVAITNTPGSTLARGAGLVLPLRAGIENAVTTKTYSNTLAMLHLMGAAFAGELEKAFEELDRSADSLCSVEGDRIAEAASALMPGDRIACIGRGPGYVSAQQLALTLSEGARCLAAAYTGGLFNHGPFECADTGLGAILFQPVGATQALMRKLAARLRGVGSNTVTFSDDPRTTLSDPNTIPIHAGSLSGREDLFPLLVSRSQCLLLDQLSRLRGIETGQYRYGSKVTSEE